MAQVMLSYRVKETGAKHLGGDDTVVQLARALESRGFSVFVGEADLMGGDRWAAEIQKAVKACQAFVVLCSPTYGDTTWTYREIQLADNNRKPIVALWHSGVFPPPEVEIFLGGEQRVPRGNNPLSHDDCDFDAVVNELVETLRRKSVLPENSPAGMEGDSEGSTARELFDRWDRNGDGVLNADEVLIGCLQNGMDPDEVSALFARLDTNGDDEISYEEWRAGYGAFMTVFTHKDELCEWLKENRLEQYETALREDLGANCVADLLHMDESDWKELGVKKLEMKRAMKALETVGRGGTDDVVDRVRSADQKSSALSLKANAKTNDMTDEDILRAWRKQFLEMHDWWDESKPINEWWGIKTEPCANSGNPRVVTVDLADILSGEVEWLHGSFLGMLTGLESLFLSDVGLTSLPAEVGNLEKLTYLDLRYNKLTSLPAELGRLTNLTCLYLKDNPITTLPSEMGNLVSAGIVDGPTGIIVEGSVEPDQGVVEELHKLRSRYPQLQAEYGWDLSKDVTSWPGVQFGPDGSLVRLEIRSVEEESDDENEDGRIIDEMPAEFLNGLASQVGKGLKNMQIMGQKLGGLPQNIGKLVTLTHLDLDRNELTSIPAALGGLGMLKMLLSLIHI